MKKMKKRNRTLTLLLAVSTELEQKFDYNFFSDSLRLMDHGDGRSYGSDEIAALAEWYGEDSEDYINALARAGIITLRLKTVERMDIIAGPDYPHGRDLNKLIEMHPLLTEYSDVSPEAWYYDAVMKASVGGLVYSDALGAFRPDEYVTVAELATVICRIYGLPVNVFYTGPWYGPYIDSIIVAGLEFNSCDRSRAVELVNRGEAIESMVIMVRALGREPVRSLTWSDVEDAEDCRAAQPSHKWSDKALLDALNYGVVDGVNAAHRMNPAAPLTRAELCKLLQNIGITTARSVKSNDAVGIYGEYVTR